MTIYSSSDFGFKSPSACGACGSYESNCCDGQATRTTLFDCQDCDGHGSKVKRNDDGSKRAELCARCAGEGKLAATEDELEEAHAIGSNNPFCRHQWAGGDEEYSRCYCLNCGADGDA